MAERIAVSAVIPDARAARYFKTLTARFPDSPLSSAAFAAAYTVDAKLSARELRRAAERLADPVTERFELGTVPAPKKFSFAVEIGFLPGVTDNVGNTARQTIEDVVGRRFADGEAVYSSVFVFLIGGITRADAEAMALELYNPLIERAVVYSAAEAKKGMPVVVPRVALGAEAGAEEVDLDVDERELAAIGRQGIANTDGTRRGPLALSLPAMKAIREHFRKLGRKPTDIELESLAQTWSEHCKHTIFADPLDDIEEGIYKRYIKGATQRIRKEKGKNDLCVSVFSDNAGGIAFDDTYLVTHKVETHNSPSALDPFGGAITGIVGVNRDCLGFGLGAKPVANVYGFCVADPTGTAELYRDKERTQPLLPPRRILEGVVRGINAGGNQSGIPTPLGFVAVDPRYRGKPLVFAGTVGLIPRKNRGRSLYAKKARAGDYIVMAGGRVGLDGIHGATFSSESLSSGSPATAVQIGDPITQKKLSDALIREARDQGLYSSITDNGAGGISCSVAEMAKECGGCVVDIEKVPVKYPGLAPWQVWISESQERMTLAVPKKNWKALKKIFDRHGVEATIIGEFTRTPRCVVRLRGKRIMDLPMAFLHDGRPIERLHTKKTAPDNSEPPTRARKGSLERAALGVLARPNIGSTSFISEQYDHEVQGTSVTKPLQGAGRVNADSGVLQPLPHSQKGIVLAHGYCPWYSDIDTYAMAACAIDTAVRNAIAAGAPRSALAILDNFCWSSSNAPERLYELKRSAKAVYDVAVAYGTPYISGKDSMFNDFRGFTAAGEPVHIAAPPTLLISAIGIMPDVSRALTLDFKLPGDSVYLIGETNDELGASEYFAYLSDSRGTRFTGSRAPHVDAKRNAKAYDAFTAANEAGHVVSAVGVGRGGLAAALARASLGGMLGAHIDLTSLPGDAREPDSILFSESQGRILFTVRGGAEAAFERLMRGVRCTKIGTTGGKRLDIRIRSRRLSFPLPALARAYRSFFKDWNV